MAVASSSPGVARVAMLTAAGSRAGRLHASGSLPHWLLGSTLWLGAAQAEALAASSTVESLLAVSSIAGMVILVALAPAFVFYVRWRTLHRLQALMMAKSQEAGPDDTAPAAPEAATLVKPVLTVFDDLGQLADAVPARERYVQRALSVFRKALAIDALAALGYAALPLTFDTIGGRIGTDGAVAESTAVGFMLGIVFLLLALIRYMLFRTQFRAVDERPWLERAAMFIIDVAIALALRGNVSATQILQWVLAPRVQIFYFAAWICIALGVAIGEQEVGLVLAACLHVGLAVWFVQSLQRIPGKRLVVLRVFGLDKNAQFLFDGVLGFWKHFGHFFTVVDPAYWRHSHRVFSLGTLAFVALAVLSIATGFWLYGMLPGNPHEDLAPLAASVFALPLLAGYAWFSERQVDRTFIRSKAHLVELLARFEKRPRNLDMTYKSLETRCYDNTWKVAVAEFARQSDVVVMDLRGYSPQREGCKFEVNFLLDTVPAERIVFVLDEQSDRETATRLILDAWQELRADSPNLAKDRPELRLYVAAAKNERDIQGVIDLLISAASLERPAAA